MARSRSVASRAKRAAFLAAYAETATIRYAAEAAGVDRVQHYRWLALDPEYKAAFEAAGQQAIERMEREALRRAVEGNEEPVYQGGERVGTVRKYSDTLLIFMLKAANPAKYRELPGSVTVNQDNRSLTLQMADDELRSVASRVLGD